MARAWTALRPLLFRLDAERAHELTLSVLSRAPELWGKVLGSGPPRAALRREVAGIPMAGPIGLAAGLDKDGVAIPFWPHLGFGFIEVGTVTAEPQPGNPRPRLFRLPESQALINRMGFNNQGSEALAARIRSLRDRGRWPAVPVGANLGKSKVTPLDEATGDYTRSVERLRGLVDWFTINVSSPNTPGLRDLQDRSFLVSLLPAVLEAARGTPVLLKLAPDLAEQAVTDAVELAAELGVSGIVATNTTISRPVPGTHEAGGLSGAPLWPLARKIIGVALDAADDRIPVIGVGGIHNEEQVQELLQAGCKAVQIYTGLIYEGPSLPAKLNRAVGSV